MNTKSLGDQKVALLDALDRSLAVASAPAWRRWFERPFPRVVTNINHLWNKLRAPVSGSDCWDVKAQPFFGLPMHVQLPEVVSNRIFSNGFFEPELSRALIICLEKGGVFYDIGAHLGYFTLLGATVVGLEGKVVAFEPTPRSFTTLTRNAGHLPQVSLQNMAVYSAATTLTFKDYGPGLSAFNTLREMKLDEAYRKKVEGRETQLEVKTCVLDGCGETSQRPPDFVKIDAESSELEVLDGMKVLLRQHRPIVSIEMGDVDGEETSSRILDVMAGYRYTAFEFMKSGQLKEHRRRNKYRYDNFLFLPAEKVAQTVMLFQQHANRRLA